MTSLNLNGAETTAALEHAAAKPHLEGDVSGTDADGGTVKAEITAGGSYWSAGAWYQWAKDKGRSYGAKVGFKLGG